MPLDWQILVVDDEPDIHTVTKLALKTRRWLGRRFELTSAMSAAEAQKILASPTCPRFQLAIVDVVMETTQAGLELCRHLRATQPRTLRIVLRTGQAGAAPKESVLNDYDIDYYLEKTEVTADKLYSVVRACIRASQDIATLSAVRDQLQRLGMTFLNETTLAQIATTMIPSLEFLENKHNVRIVFFPNFRDPAVAAVPGPSAKQTHDTDAKCEEKRKLLLRADEAGPVPDMELRDVSTGLAFMRLEIVEQAKSEKPGFFGRLVNMISGSKKDPVAGLVVEYTSDELTLAARDNFAQDTQLFLENWRVAHRAVLVREAVSDNLARLGSGET